MAFQDFESYMNESMDALSQYNTSLSQDDEQKYQNWAAHIKTDYGRDPTKELAVYDLRGYWKATPPAEVEQWAMGATHAPDTWKKPPHETFSNESIYATKEHPGGTWQGEVFIPAQPQDFESYMAGQLGGFDSFMEKETVAQPVRDFDSWMTDLVGEKSETGKEQWPIDVSSKTMPRTSLYPSSMEKMQKVQPTIGPLPALEADVRAEIAPEIWEKKKSHPILSTEYWNDLLGNIPKGTWDFVRGMVHTVLPFEEGHEPYPEYGEGGGGKPTLKEILKPMEASSSLATFIPRTLRDLAVNGPETLRTRPTEVILALAALRGGGARALRAKIKSDAPIKAADVVAAAKELPDDLLYEKKLSEIQKTSARVPEELKTFSEMSRTRITQPEEMAAGEEIRVGRDLDTGELVIEMPKGRIVQAAEPTTTALEVSPRGQEKPVEAKTMATPTPPTGDYVIHKSTGNRLKVLDNTQANTIIVENPQGRRMRLMRDAVEFPGVKPSAPQATPQEVVPAKVSAPQEQMPEKGAKELYSGYPMKEELKKSIENIKRNVGVGIPVNKDQVAKDVVEFTSGKKFPKAWIDDLPEMIEDNRQLLVQHVLENYDSTRGPLENYVRNSAKYFRRGMARSRENQPILQEIQYPEIRGEGGRIGELEPTRDMIPGELAERKGRLPEGIEVPESQRILSRERAGVVADDILREAARGDENTFRILKARYVETSETGEAASFDVIGKELGITKDRAFYLFRKGLARLSSPDKMAENIAKLRGAKELYAGYPMGKEIRDSIKSIRRSLGMGMVEGLPMAGTKEPSKIIPEKQPKIQAEPMPTTIRQGPLTTGATKVEKMYLDTDKALKERSAPSFKKAVEFTKNKFVDVSGNVKKKLLKDLGQRGKEAVINHDLIAGASAKTEKIFEKASQKIYDGLSKEQETALNRTIQSRRTIAISKYKPDVKHPGGLTGAEHTEYLKSIPKEINDRADLYFKEMDNALDNLKSEGLISPEEHTALKSKGDYSPRVFIQHVDPNRTYTVSGKTITVPDSGIKALDEGSVGLMETNSRLLLSNVIGRTQARIFRNKANQALWNIAKDVPDNGLVKEAKLIRVTEKGEPVYEPAPGGYTKVATVIDGKTKEMIVPDKFAEEWVTQDPAIDSQMANIMGWVLGGKILRPMATGLNPEFAITNLPRDILHVYLTTDEYSSFLPKFSAQVVKDMATVAKDAVTRKGRWVDYINEGGGMSFLTHQGRSITGGPLKGFQYIMGYLGETSEILTRLALRERALKNGKVPSEATWTSRNYIDFSQGGSWAKAIDKAIPYFNASIQGTRGVFRAAAQRPAQTAWKLAQLGTAATGLLLANRFVNPEAWDSVPDREKVNNWIITTPWNTTDKNGNVRHVYFKVAKDQAQRVLCTAFENMVSKALGDKVNVGQITQSIRDFLPIVPVDMIPPTMEAILGYAENKNFWTNDDIWKGEKVTPREEYTNYTHPALVEVGKLTGASPERLKYALSNFFSQGNIFTSIVGGAFSLAMKDAPEGDKRKVTAEIMQGLPFARRGFKLTPPYSEKEIREVERVKVEETTERLIERRGFDELLNDYYRPLKDENRKDPVAKKEIDDFIKEAKTPEDRKRLIARYKNYGKVFGIPDRSWWLRLPEIPPEARAGLYWAKYSKLDTPEEKKKLESLARTIPGIWSDPFLKYLRGHIHKSKEKE